MLRSLKKQLDLWSTMYAQYFDRFDIVYLLYISISIYAEKGTNRKQAERAVTGSDIDYETRRDLFEVTLPRRVSISWCSGTFMG